MPTFASSSRVQLAYKPESVFGTIATPGNPYALRFTGESLDMAVQKERSNEINANRAISSVVPVGADASGGVQGELTYGEYDRLIAALLQGTFAAYGTNGVGTSFSATYTATTITAGAAPTGSSAFINLKPGQWFRITSGTGANDGRYFRVHKTTAPTTTVITLDPGTPATVEGPIASTAIQTSRLTNGTTQSSFTIERQITDIGQYMAYRGMTPSKGTISLASKQLTTISLDFMGQGMVNGTSTQLPGTLQPSLAYDIQSGVSSTGCQLWQGGAPLASTYMKTLSLEYDNNLRGQDALCNMGNIGVGSGDIAMKITADIYFADVSYYNAMINNTYTELSFSSLDPQGNGYFFTAPRANVASVKSNASGKNQDMMCQVVFECVRDAGNADASLRQVLFIDRVGDAITP